MIFLEWKLDTTVLSVLHLGSCLASSINLICTNNKQCHVIALRQTHEVARQVIASL